MYLKLPLLIGVSAFALTYIAGSPSFAEEAERVTVAYDLRARYETADSDTFPERAEATTVRLRLGAEAKFTPRFSFLAEGEAIGALQEDYNSLTNDKTQFPVIADPEIIELNRLQLTYSPTEQTQLTLGRQKLALDDQRFLGAVNFRQNQQTFDAFSVAHHFNKHVSARYAYIDNVHRILGDDHPAGDFESDSHIALLRSEIGPVGTLSTFAYLLDFENAPGLSSQTYGARLAGKKNLTPDNAFAVRYTASAAWQSDYGGNPNAYEASYLQGEAGLQFRKNHLTLGLERLGSDNGTPFTTPLATLHKFQGFADVFLATPSDGILDTYLKVGTGMSILDEKTLKLKAAFHDFETAKGGADLGHEFDFVASLGLTDNLSLEAKAAHFDGSVFGPADLTRVFFSINYKSKKP